MRILGLDPGSRFTGYGLVDRSGDGLAVVSHGRFAAPRGRALAQRLHGLTAELERCLEEWRPAVAVLEAPFLGLNPRSLVVLAQARGALMAALAGRGLAVHEYSPAEVKSAVTGNGRADKQQVARMVGLHLRLDAAAASSDATDALALAICFAHRERVDRLTGRGPR